MPNGQAWQVVDAIRRIDELGVENVARLFVGASAAQRRVDDWIVGAVVFGEDWTGSNTTELPVELWWELGMAALDACSDDDSAYWLLGDGTFDHLRVRPGIEARLRAERSRNPRVERLFLTMRRELPKEGVSGGFWFE